MQSTGGHDQFSLELRVAEKAKDDKSLTIEDVKAHYRFSMWLWSNASSSDETRYRIRIDPLDDEGNFHVDDEKWGTTRSVWISEHMSLEDATRQLGAASRDIHAWIDEHAPDLEAEIRRASALKRLRGNC